MDAQLSETGTYDPGKRTMAKASVAYLLIATVMVCPYLCLGEDAEAVDACATQVRCSCSDEPANGDKVPPESPDDEGRDCLCQGAIEAVKADDSSCCADELLLCRMSPLELDLSRPSYACSTLESGHSVHFPPLSSGREICALVNARLL